MHLNTITTDYLHFQDYAARLAGAVGDANLVARGVNGNEVAGQVGRDVQRAELCGKAEAAAGGAGAGAGASSSGAKASDADVVDAEFTEVKDKK